MNAPARIYQPKFQPYDHQARGLQQMQGKDLFALLMAMRTGKTKVALDDYGQLELDGKAHDFLLLAPAGVYRTWLTALREHGSDDIVQRMWPYIWESGNNTKAAKNLRAAFMNEPARPRMLLMNVEALSTVQEARNMVTQFVMQRRKVYQAVDESVVIKNWDSNRTQFIVSKLGPHYAYKRILTGLPTPKDPLDLFGQFTYLNQAILGYYNWVAFRARYAKVANICMLKTAELQQRLRNANGGEPNVVLPGFGRYAISDMSREHLISELQNRNVWFPTIPQIRGYQHEDELRDKIAPYVYRCRLEDCYDMPPSVYMRREVSMTPEQARIYGELKTFCTARLNEQDYVTATQVITQMMRLHQVLCGHTVDEAGNEHEIETNRPKELLAAIDELENDQKVIIWCVYDKDIQRVVAALRHHYGENSVARFWGGNRKTREEEERKFQNDPAVRFMVATQSAGGRGRMWAVANTVIYYSNSDNLDHRSQSEERPKAMNKRIPIAYIDLVTPGTVDEKFITSLRRKINMATAITGDNYQEWLI
jgi:hypothetical protein